MHVAVIQPDWTRKTFLLNAPSSEFTQNVSTKGSNTERRVSLAGPLRITFQVCDAGDKRS